MQVSSVALLPQLLPFVKSKNRLAISGVDRRVDEQPGTVTRLYVMGSTANVWSPRKARKYAQGEIAHRLMDDHVWAGAFWGPQLNKEEPNHQTFRLAQREAMPSHATGPRIPAHPYQSIKSYLLLYFFQFSAF